MLLSDDEDAIKKARFWITQARDPAPWYQHSELGYNYRMSNIVAGIGRGQLLHLDQHRQLKEDIYMRYADYVPSSQITYLPAHPPSSKELNRYGQKPKILQMMLRIASPLIDCLLKMTSSP